MKIWVLCLSLLLPEVVMAATYYVGTNGSDSNTTTQAQNSSTPWLTIQKCANTAISGDTCSVNDGIYTVASTTNFVTITTSGVTYKSTNQYGARINGQTNLTAVGFNIDSANNVTIQDFEIYGFLTGINANGTSASSGLTINGNLIHHMGVTCNNSGSGFVGIYTKDGTSGLTINNNILHTIGRYQTGQNGCSLTGGGQTGQNDHGIYIHGGSNAIIRNNVFYNIIYGWSIHAYPNTSTSLNIWNNVFADTTNTQGHIRFASLIASSDFANNIFYQPNACAFNGTSSSFSGVTVRNNSISNTANLWCSTPAGTTNTNTVSNSNPLFTNPAGRDYTLLAGSPAIDTGVNVGLSFNGLAPDRGAFETGGDTTPPAAPTGLTVQ